MLVGILLLLILNIGNAKNVKSQFKSETKQKITKNQNKENEKFQKIMESFELEAVIETTKGKVNVFLYPEAAPKNVANFVFLAKNGFYDGLTFYRAIPNVFLQSGDPLENGTGDTGYFVKDEIVGWLNFDVEGVLAMSNKGANTNSSQFFFMLMPADKLNGKYTIIGRVKNKGSLSVLKSIEKEDKIKTINIRGYKVNDFLNYFINETQEWPKFLKNYKQN